MSYAGDKSPFLITPHYKIFIDEHCSEYDIACNNVTYTSVNKKTGLTLTLKGATINVGPSQDFRGYDFPNGEYLYRLIPSDKDSSRWELLVMKKGHVLLQESGTGG